MFHVEQYGDLVADYLDRHAVEAKIKLSTEQLRQFSLYASELVLWNEKINLTTVTDMQEVAIKHFLDSLYGSLGIGEYDAGSHILDVGTGAGFPGIPLKILLSRAHLYLLEKITKGIILANIVGKLKLANVSVINRSLEDVSIDHAWQLKFTHLVVRAVNMENCLPYTRSLMVGYGKIILYRTSEMDDASLPKNLKISRTISYTLPYGHGKRVLQVLEHS